MGTIRSTIRLLFLIIKKQNVFPIVVAVYFSLLCLSVLFSGRSQQQEMEPLLGPSGAQRGRTSRSWDHRRKGRKDRERKVETDGM